MSCLCGKDGSENEHTHIRVYTLLKILLGSLALCSIVSGCIWFCTWSYDKLMKDRSNAIIPGDSMVELGYLLDAVDADTVNKLCTPYYETILYSTNGNVLKKYITITEPEHGEWGSLEGIVISEFRASFQICKGIGSGYTITKKEMPISWLVNTLGEYSYDGRKITHYNHYLQSKRALAPKWDEAWWELLK